MKTILLAIALLGLTAPAKASNYYDLQQTASSTTMKLTGNIDLTTGSNRTAGQAHSGWSADKGFVNAGPNPWIDAAAYGAVADGLIDSPSVGTDNAAAIQRAINALPTDGGVVLLSSGGVYRVASTLSIPSLKKVVLQGIATGNTDGTRGTRIYCTMTNGTDCIDATSTSYKQVEIHQLTIYGNTSAGWGVAISSGADGHFYMGDVFVGYFGKGGILIDGCPGGTGSTSNNRLENVRLRANKGPGIALGCATSATFLDNVTGFTNSSGTLVHYGTSLGVLGVNGGDYSNYNQDSPSFKWAGVTLGQINNVYIEVTTGTRNNHIIDIDGSANDPDGSTLITGNQIAGADQTSGTGLPINLVSSTNTVIIGNRINCGTSRLAAKGDANTRNTVWLGNTTVGCSEPSFAGTGTFYQDQNGNIAIGTAPVRAGFTLDVYKSNDSALSVRNSTGERLIMQAANPSRVGIIGSASTNSLYLGADLDNNSAQLYITTRATTGAVGVKISSPSFDFQVNGTSGFGNNTSISSFSAAGALSLASALAVNNGGTGATSAATARTSLGAAASGANSDITSLSNLSTPLTVAQGGTGLATLTSNGVLVGSGTASMASVPPMAAGGLVIGNQVGLTPSTGTLTGTTNQVNVTNASGKITLSTPQSIDSTADVTHNTLTLASNMIAAGSFNRFGLGSASVGSALYFENLGVYRDAQAGFTASSIGDVSLLTMLSARGSHASKTTVLGGDGIGNITWRGYVGSQGYVTGAAVVATATGAITNATNGLAIDLDFKTRSPAANLLTRMRVANDGSVVMGDPDNGPTTLSTFTANGFLMIQRATETVAGGATITADSCGGVKLINSSGAQTTSTVNTFTAPAASNQGCKMLIINIGASNITLDANPKFITASGADVVMTPNDVTQVYSTGWIWYEIEPLLAL